MKRRLFGTFGALTLDGPDDTSWGIDDLNFIEPGAYMALSETR